MEFIRFILSGFWTWAGFLILLVAAGNAAAEVVTIEKEGGKSSAATKLMALMGLGIKGGDTVIVTVEGGDVDANVQVVKKFLTENL